MDYLITSHLNFLGIHTSIYTRIPCNRKYGGQRNQCDIRAAHDGKVEWDTIEYTAAIVIF